jgi:hypothetical protein
LRNAAACCWVTEHPFRWQVATDEEVISAITQFLILLWVISSTPLSEERQNVRLNVPRSWLQPESFGFET